MKRAWSFFWLVVASCIALAIISSWVKPYVGLIAALIIIALLVTGVVVTLRLFRGRSGQRRHF